MDFCFIITRCVVDERTNKYWNECYRCIRKLYENLIVIIDDSPEDRKIYIKKENDIVLTNYIIIETEYKKCGELLGYYYFYKNKFAKYAYIIHDSIFIQEILNIEECNVIPFWHFEHHWDDNVEEIKLLEQLKNSKELVSFYKEKDKWKGMFGVMSFINYDFLSTLQDKYNIFNLIPVVNTRERRMCIERIMALLCKYEDRNMKESFLGKIHDFLPWGFTFNQYLIDRKKKNIYKVWSGR